MDSLRKVYRRFGRGFAISTAEKPDVQISLNLPSSLKRFKIFPTTDETFVDDIIDKSWSNKLTRSGLFKRCVVCDTDQKVEMHHLRKVGDKRRNHSFPQWMGLIERKQIPLCRAHHIDLHRNSLTPEAIQKIQNYR